MKLRHKLQNEQIKKVFSFDKINEFNLRFVIWLFVTLTLNRRKSIFLIFLLGFIYLINFSRRFFKDQLKYSKTLDFNQDVLKNLHQLNQSRFDLFFLNKSRWKSKPGWKFFPILYNEWRPQYVKKIFIYKKIVLL